MGVWLATKGLVALVVLVAALSIVSGVGYLAGVFAGDTDGGRGMEIGVGIVLITAGVLMAAGLWIVRQRQARGTALLAACSVPLGVCFWWTGIAPLLTALVLGSTALRSRRRARKQPATP